MRFCIQLIHPLSALVNCYQNADLSEFRKLTLFMNKKTCHPEEHLLARNDMQKFRQNYWPNDSASDLNAPNALYGLRPNAAFDLPYFPLADNIVQTVCSVLNDWRASLPQTPHTARSSLFGATLVLRYTHTSVASKLHTQIQKWMEIMSETHLPSSLGTLVCPSN